MVVSRRGARALVDEVLLGAWLGFLVLGVGGRAVMRAIALVGDAPGVLTLGGTVTVLAAGAAAGAAGALLHALGRAVAARLAAGRAVVRVVLFAALLALVTARGLRGSPPGSAMWFWPLVVLHGALFLRILARRAARAEPDAPPRAVALAG